MIEEFDKRQSELPNAKIHVNLEFYSIKIGRNLVLQSVV